MEVDTLLSRAKLRVVLKRYTRDSHLIDDVCQITLVKCWQYVCKNGVNPPNRFIRVVGLREFYSIMRKRKPQEIPAGYDGVARTVSPIDSLEHAEESSMLHSAIEKLPRRYQLPARLHFVDGLPYAVIATHSHRCLGTVKTWIHRAERLLCKQLREDLRN